MGAKKVRHLLTALSLLISSITVSYAQNFQPSIQQAFEHGNVRELSKYFDKRVQVTIDHQSNNYSTGQAEIIVKNFLDGLGKKDFRLLHSSNENSGAVRIFTGEIRSGKGNYKAYIYIRKIGVQSFVQELRFEKI